MSYYSQLGEDRWITENLPLPEHGVFVDVGAGDGVTHSNTLIFEERGWSGICIEPDPRAFLSLIDRRSHCLNAAVRTYTGLTPFILSDLHSDLSRVREPFGTGRNILTPCIRLDTVLQYEGITRIDLLSIDVEGLEHEVLSSFSFSLVSPSIVIVEHMTKGVSNDRESLESFFADKPHSLVHETVANLIYFAG